MKYVSGEIFKDNKIKNGYLGFEKGKIIETGLGNPPKKPICKGLIVPSFVNAHTHIGDSFIREKNIDLPKSIEKLVAPPHGLKHKLLKNATDDDIINGMEKTINFMIENGTDIFYDYRENGVLGICQLKAALHLKNISSIILSRPESLDFVKAEIDILLKSSDGIAVSSITDWDFLSLKKIAKLTFQKNKIFSLHASERIREDIDDILDLKPNFLVHMLKATESDLQRVNQEKIPIVICPKANSFFNIKPNFDLLKKVGINLLIGTDNAMINPPDILNEIKFIRRKTKNYSLLELLDSVTFKARKVLNLDCNILGPNSKASFVVLDKKFLKPLYISVAK